MLQLWVVIMNYWNNVLKIETRIKPEKCKTCKNYDNCKGIYKTYYELFEDEDLTPL